MIVNFIYVLGNIIKMILIINTCEYKLSEKEFVTPIANIVKRTKKEYHIKHYKEVDYVEDYEKIIIWGLI